MRIFASIILLLVALPVGSMLGEARQAGESNQEIASLVSQLSWDSVGGECNFIWRIFPDGEAAKKLIQIGKPATDELLKVLEDENKGVAARLILTQIWEPKNVSFRNRLEGDKFIHTYNGLEWVDIIQKKGVKYKVEKVALARNAEEWRRKVAEYRGKE